MNLLDRRRTVAPSGYNRWLVPPAALAVHLSIGQVYAFSVIKEPLIERFFPETGVGTPIAVIFSIAIVMLGLSAAFGGVWMERNGPRKAMVLSATFWVTGFLVAALGVHLGHLWLVYLGYGVIGGMGLGIGYISPVSTLIKWFPDRPGLATGLAIMGFGGGALVAAPLTQWLLGRYATEPVDALVPTLLTLAAIYAVLMAAGAAVIRLPAPGWAPAGWTPSVKKGAMQTHADVRVRNAVRTPQFYLLWIVLFVNVTAGIGILEDAKPMILDFFPDTVTEASATGFVGLLALANMSGRLGWSSLSDKIGRKNTYVMYLGVGAALYTVLALAGSTATALFVTVAFFIVTFYGGGFATVPAYLKDLFGKLEVGAIHGRLLTAWSAAGVAGPVIVNSIVDSRREAGLEGADLYIPSMTVMACLLVVGFVANLLVRPVSDRHHEPVPTTTTPERELVGAAKEA
ncbi:OFA family MFS transporter [Actinotalea sp. AC32]|nr:OFA family MFS transporter [Actinotalea sp. AC32]